MLTSGGNMVRSKAAMAPMMALRAREAETGGGEAAAELEAGIVMADKAGEIYLLPSAVASAT
jgi:hypothetical protein